MRHGSVTVIPVRTGAVRTVPGASGHGMPASAHPEGLGPSGCPSNVHSTAAGGAAVAQIVPRRSSTVVVRASP